MPVPARGCGADRVSHGLLHDREDFIVCPDYKVFVIMKCLFKSHAWKPHPPPQAHFPRVPGVFLADRIIVGRYPGIAWVRPTITGAGKAVARGAVAAADIRAGNFPATFSGHSDAPSAWFRLWRRDPIATVAGEA